MTISDFDPARPHADTVAVVTGGAQGLGRAIAERLIAEGCTRLVIAGRSEDAGRAAAAEMSGEAEVIYHRADMADTGQARGLIDAAAETFGRVTALVNAAASTGRASILDATPEGFNAMFAVNTRGPYFALQRLAQRAVEAGHPAQAVNILSMAAHCGQSFLSPYSASKAALENVTRNAAQALRGHRIRVNAINCGWMDTPGEDAVQRKWHGGGDDWLEKAEAAQPMGMLVKPVHVAPLASYMLGPASGVMTGAVVDFDQTVAGSCPE